MARIVQGLSIIIDIDTWSTPRGNALGFVTQNVEVYFPGLEVLRGREGFGFCILQGDDVTLTEVDLIVIQLWREGLGNTTWRRGETDLWGSTHNGAP